MSNFFLYIKSRKALFYLFVILFLASVLRFYRIGDFLTFLGDEGRDVLVAKGIIEGFSSLFRGDFLGAKDGLTLLGPRASAGDFFLGPIYYYFMAPFLFLFNYDPVGPAVMVAIFGVVTVWLVYYVGLVFFNKKIGLISALLYSISPIVIAYSRSSWNPNLMPFFSILILFCIYRHVVDQKKKLLIIAGVLFGVAMQLHYLSVFLGVIIFLYLLLINIYTNKKINLLDFIYKKLIFFGGFVIGFLPFLMFELTHNFSNSKSIVNFIFSNTFEKEYVKTSFFGIVSEVFFRIFARLVSAFPPPEQIGFFDRTLISIWAVGIWVFALGSIAILLSVLYKSYKSKDVLQFKKYLLIVVWFFTGIFLFGFYKKPIYEYYFGFMFPLPFLLTAQFLDKIYSTSKLKIIAVLLLVFLIAINFLKAPFFFMPNRQKDQVREISHFVLSKTNNKPYNFALITLGNSDHAYKYYFEIEKKSPVIIENEDIDPKRKTVTDQLFIVCEDISCQPLGNSLWEVAGFGRAEIEDVWDVSVVKVYKLIPYKAK